MIKEIALQSVDHCVPYTDPYDLEAPTKVLHPSPRCVSELMAGGIHPPIEAIHNQRLVLTCENCGEIECRVVEAPAIRAKHKIKNEIVIDNSAAHLTVAPPMSYEEAIEWIIKKDIPFDVWGKPHNQPQFVILERTAMPSREYRNTWKMENITA